MLDEKTGVIEAQAVLRTGFVGGKQRLQTPLRG